MATWITKLVSPWRQGKAFNRRQWLRFEGWFAVVSALFVYQVAGYYLPYVQISHTHGLIYLVTAYISHFAFFSLLVWLFLLPLVLIFPNRYAVLAVSGLSLTACLVLLSVDTTVYSQYRFHLSGFVWEILKSSAADEMIQLSWYTKMVIALTILQSAVMALLGLSAALWCVTHKATKGKGKYIFAIWLVALIGSQLMHLWYEAHYDPEVTGITRHFPGYYPVSAKRLLQRTGLLDPEAARAQSAQFGSSGTEQLSYPVRPLQCVSPDQPVNVLVIAVDAMRFDMLNKQVTPNLYALSQHKHAQYFKQHYSGGNVTKSGIFSLFYGLPATYWDGFAAAQSGALWIRQHQLAGYQMGAFSSASLVSPAFDRTVFASLPQLRLQTPGSSAIERDVNTLADIRKFVANRDRTQPFFAFLFLDAAHGPEVPHGHQPFQPSWDRVDHVKLDNSFNPLPYLNRYKNALHWLDNQLGELLTYLHDWEELEDTLLIITADHGEEFNDMQQNYWGHGGNFMQYQTRVPLLMKWPGKSRQVWNHRTSHFDLAPTIMSEVLGCSNPASDYSIGGNLFDPEFSREWLLVHSYYNFGIVQPDRVIATYPGGMYEVLDMNNKLHEDQKIPPEIGRQVLEAMSRFYQQ